MPGDKMVNIPDTTQIEHWKGNFGKEYNKRSLLTPEEVDRDYERKYGTTRSVLNQRFLAGIPRTASVLEVGCGLGTQLLALQQIGFTNLHAIEIQREVVKQARERLPSAEVTEGSALQIPYADASFDLVFTAGVLVTIAPQHLLTALREIHRTSRTWIWGMEYYAPEMTEILYRGHRNLLWKTDYARLFLQSFDDLELVLEERLSYLQDNNVDTMYLLRRKRK